MSVIQTNDTNRIVIEEKEFEDNIYIDVRKQYLDKSGDWLRTRKGLTVTPREWEEIIEELLPMMAREFRERLLEPKPGVPRDDVPF